MSDARRKIDGLASDERTRLLIAAVTNARALVSTQQAAIARSSPAPYPTLVAWAQAVTLLADEAERLGSLRAAEDWHEGYGTVLWWQVPVSEAPYCGSPLDTAWPGYHTHWTPLPVLLPILSPVWPYSERDGEAVS